MLAKVVMLYLTVYNCDTGAVLYQTTRQMPEFSVSGDRVEDCRKTGVQQAKTLMAHFQEIIPTHYFDNAHLTDMEISNRTRQSYSSGSAQTEMLAARS